jgi:hypothetical protein
MRASAVAAALVIAVAVSGTAIAAKDFVITSTRQIKPSVLKQLAGKRGPEGPRGPRGHTGRTGHKGATGARGPRGARGRTGPRGKRGTRGPAGATSVVTRTQSSAATAVGQPASVEVVCASGEHVVGGGGEWASGDATNTSIVSNRPSAGGSADPPANGAAAGGWHVAGRTNHAPNDTLKAYVVCAKP